VRLRRQPKADRLSSVIKPQILASIAMKNLLAKRLRTALTITGIVIGVGAVVFLVSLALGLHAVVNKQVIGSKSVSTIDVTSPNANTVLLNDANVNKISQFANVVAAAPAYILAGQISYQGSQANTVVYGTNNQYMALSGIKSTAGSIDLTTSRSAVVNTALLNLIGQTSAKAAINQKLVVQTTVNTSKGTQKKVVVNLTISGVVNTSSGATVYTAGQVFANAGATRYGQLKVLANNRKDVPVIRQRIEGLGLSTASPLDTLSQINTIFTIFGFVVAGFGGIGMVIAILGMFNTLTISMIERTREIGLMITLGGRKADVQRLLTFEALILSLSGGLVGICGAWLLGQTINLVLTHYATHNGVEGTIHAFSITPLLILGTLIMTVAAGLLVSLYPARRATRINPVIALKHE
jgi:putative ABC transport system permease protein